MEENINSEENEEEEIESLNILPSQVAHFKKVLNILQNEVGYLDVSLFGSGKSFCALAVAITFKMGLILVAPKTAIPQWRRIAKKYGVHIYTALTYNALRGTEKGGVSHDLLTRNGSEFIPTETIEQCARSGLLIVYDECHYLKNENSQLEAAAAISKEAVRLSRMGCNVRIAALSATPADKKENITNLFRILGIVLEPNLYRYNRSTKKYVLEGLQEAINKCNRYDRDNTFHIICRSVNKSTSKLICHELYTRVLKNVISSSMPKPDNGQEQDIKNIFAIMPKEDVERMKAGALLFASATSYRPETGMVNYASMDWGKITESRREIDSAKVATVCRLAREELDRDKNCKVLLYFTYKRDLRKAKELLEEYGCLILNGEITKDEDRVQIMEAFQKPDTEYRVFISNPKVGGASVSLDDLYGGFKRHTFIAPSYNFIDEWQCCGRSNRLSTKSDSSVKFVYSKAFPYESSILQSIAEKSQVARDMSQDLTILFPGEIESIIEGEDDM